METFDWARPSPDVLEASLTDRQRAAWDWDGQARRRLLVALAEVVGAPDLAGEGVARLVVRHAGHVLARVAADPDVALLALPDGMAAGLVDLDRPAQLVEAWAALLPVPASEAPEADDAPSVADLERWAAAR